MAQQLTNYTSALKEVLLPYIQDNYPKASILLDKMRSDSGYEFINDEFMAPVRTSRHGGVTNLADDGNSVISSSGVRTGRGTVGVKIVTGAFDITNLAIEASKTGKGAVEADLTFQAEKLTSDFARNLNRQLYSDGVGVLSQVAGSTSGTEFTVMTPDANLDDGRSIDWYGTINGDVAPNEYFAQDQIIGVGTAGAADGTVAAVTATSVQLTGATASAANDAVFIEDGSGEGAGTMEMQGVRLALSSSTGTSTYAGLARSTYGWTPQFGSASEALTQSRMTLDYLAARKYAQTGDKYVILVNQSLFAKYGDILTSMRRTVNETELIGGFTGLEFAAGAGKVGVFLDYQVPDGEVIILNLDTWKLCQVGDMKWLDDAGSMLRLQNTLIYQALMVWYANAICLAPAASARETRKTD